MRSGSELRVGLTGGIIAVAASWWLAPGAGAAPIATHEVGQSSATVRGYWTAERMREAVPLDGASTGADAAAPTAAASAAPPDQEIPASLDTTYPYRVHGRLFVTFGNENGSCSATVVTSYRRDLVLTAAHCLAMTLGVGQTQWATNVLFVPAYRDHFAPYGVYTASRLAVPGAYPYLGVSVDTGAVNVTGDAAQPIQDRLGSRGIAFNKVPRSLSNRTLQLFGYPADPSPAYDGERPILCSSQVSGFEGETGSLLAAPCNQAQGASGGGWILGDRLLVSVTSHAWITCGGFAGCHVLAGPYFGGEAFHLWAGAGGPLPKGRRKRIRACKHKRAKNPKKTKRKRARCLSRAETFQPVVR